MSEKSKAKINEFLDDDCGQNALQLAARGSALIAEILRLSEFIPSAFREPHKHPECAAITSDFQYFSNQDTFERRIQNSAELLTADEAFRETHMEILERFFKLLRGIYGYAIEVSRFIEDVKEGHYISQTIESILVHPDGKQLMCEVFSLFGVMLLLIDAKVPGVARERLIVSYIRYKGAGEQSTVEISSLFRATGYSGNDAKLPPSYPENYFARVPTFPKDVIALLIGRIRSDDIYQMALHYPSPEHRSTALSAQGAMLFVLLYFRPEIMKSERQVMREIVDKHFADNWVIAYYLGFTADLIVWWAPFPAASSAIAGTIHPDSVAYHQGRQRAAIKASNADIAGLLREGVLIETFVLDSINSTLLPRLREANVALRWFMLHLGRALGVGGIGPQVEAAYKSVGVSFDATMRLVCSEIQTNDLLTLMLSTAQLEFVLKQMFSALLKEKKTRWNEAKEVGERKMNKLAEYFSGEHLLSESDVKSTQLEAWFRDIASRLEGLSYHDSTIAGRKIQRLSKALESVQEFHQIDNNLQVIQFILDTRALLKQMLRVINIERKVLVTIGAIGELSYAWGILATHKLFVAELQRKIKAESHLVVQMRSTFIKLASILLVPCNRIQQASENDPTLNHTLESVSEFYSGELIVFVRMVLHVIPTSIFAELREITNLLISGLQACPTKVAKAQMREQSQLEIRRRLAAHTSEIAMFASGVLAMESTLVGVIQVDPHKILEDGIRKELTKQISDELHNSVTFDAKRPLSAEEFDKMLSKLSRQFQGMREAFEYIQDYVSAQGLRMWLEEFSRIVNFNVEMECNSFLSKKLYHWKSRYQSENIPIPYYSRENESDAYSFLGRLVQHLLAMTDPVRCRYIPSLAAWFDNTGKETVGVNTFKSINLAIGHQGLHALDRLICFIIAKDCQTVISLLRKKTEPQEKIFEEFERVALPTSGVPREVINVYKSLDIACGKLFDELTTPLVRIGRLQLVRKHIASELRSACKLLSGALYSALGTLNASLVADIHKHYTSPLDVPMPGSIVSASAPFLDAAGFGESWTKIYITTKPFSAMPFLLMGFSLRTLPRMTYEPLLSCLVKSNEKDNFDVTAFCWGLHTIMQQFHGEQRRVYYGLLTQYIRVSLCEFDHLDPKVKEKEVVPREGATMSRFFRSMLAAGNQVRADQLDRFAIPQLLVDEMGMAGKS